MEETTYRDEAVAALINTRYLAVRVDQDADPDLSVRYGRWGWPATIVFAPDGSEIVKIRGYIPPPRMIAMLQAIIDDPSPGPSVVAESQVIPSDSGALSDASRDTLVAAYLDLYDPDYGSWGTFHKFVNPPALEYALERSRRGGALYTLMARQTLSMGRHLIDPVWGGVYQYSDQVDWLSPHFEKIMYYQAEYLRLYSLAYARWQHADHLSAALDVHRYLRTFLLGDHGGFYASQDADLNSEVDGKAFFALGPAERAELGMPKIDQSVYARENGWAIRGLTALYDATGMEEALQQALGAANYVLQHRSLPGGGFRHGEADRAGPYLGDTQAMAQAFLGLYASIGDRSWLSRATAALDFVEREFRRDDGGYVTTSVAADAVGVFAKPAVSIEENAAVARTANLTARYTGEQRFADMADHALRYLASPQIVEEIAFLPDVIVADDEISRDPVHITVVGERAHPGTQGLHQAARRYPAGYRRIELWDRSEGPLPNPDVRYPMLDRPAAFACANRSCSLPIYDGEQIADAVDLLMRAGGAYPQDEGQAEAFRR